MQIKRFDSWEHFHEIEDTLNNMVIKKELEEIHVSEPYANSTLLEERWFKCQCGDIWRLVKPDFPFKGIFEKVK